MIVGPKLAHHKKRDTVYKGIPSAYAFFSQPKEFPSLTFEKLSQFSYFEVYDTEYLS